MSQYQAILLAALLFAGCRATTPPLATTPPPATAPLAAAQGRVTPDVHWTEKSAEYRASTIQIYGWAEQRLAELIGDREPGTWAVALDADETVISNVQYQIEIGLAGSSYSRASFDEWTKRQAAPPLAGALAFLARVREAGGKIAIVTNRRQSTCADTETNFKVFSIPYDVMLCRTETGEKEQRWQMIENGTAAPDLPPLEIVMWLGDNIQDFPDFDQDLRLQDEDAFARFGKDFFIFPNPMYGSWEDLIEE